MDVAIGERWEGFVREAVKDGKFESASDVVNEGLRLVQAREATLQALRETIQASIARGGAKTGEQVLAAVEAELDEWERENIAK
ncbi:type II toxin-antitoxin system ParD family antitoxin [Sphingomonas qilianensis]|uniref:Type II toxin-antitoxin system ParD family antitoxin n=1 Tax=Sphingomonas qilianensis TaxID=1736690 RepID=A0ABU9XM11_9SPHN